MVLVHLVHAGTRVHQGDVLAGFDQQDQLKQFRDSQADYLGFLDKIKKQQADNSIELGKDQTALQAADDEYQKPNWRCRRTKWSRASTPTATA